MPPRVLIIIPAHNEEQSIANVLLTLRRSAPDYDRIVVNDGSQDATSSIIERLGEKQLVHPCNLGYGQALQTGMMYALQCGYDVVVCFDGDGQHQPQDVLPLVHALIAGDADIVIGSRYSGTHPYSHVFSHRIGQILFSILSRILLGQRIYDTSSGFKAFRASVCRVFVKSTFMDFHTEALVRLKMMGFKILEHPVVDRERAFGQSMYSGGSLLEYPLKTLLLTLVAVMDVFLARRAR